MSDAMDLDGLKKYSSLTADAWRLWYSENDRGGYDPSVENIWQTREQEANLKKYASLSPPGAIVELGTSVGFSARFLLDGRKDPSRNPVFLFEPDSSCHAAVKVLLSGYDHVVFVPAEGQIFHEFWRMPIALLHEDNGHYLSCTLMNLKTYGPSIVPGGYLIFHDWDASGYPGIRQAFEAWDEAGDFEEVSLCGPAEMQQLILKRKSRD